MIQIPLTKFNPLLALLLGVCIIPGISANGDPNTNTLVQSECFTGGYYNCDICPCSLPTPYLQIGLTLSILSLLATSILVFGFCFLRKLREKPGDIIFMMALAQFIYSIDWIIQSIGTMTNNDIETQNLDSCRYTTGITFFAKVLFGFYNLSFFWYIINNMKRALKQSVTSTRMYHLCAWLAAIVDTLFRVYSNGLGLNIYGECADKTTQAVTIPLMYITAFSIIPCYSRLIAVRQLPRSARVSIIRQQFLAYYNIYVMVTSIIYVTLYTDQLIVSNSVDEYIKEAEDTESLGPLEIVVLAGALLRTATPVFLTYIRLSDPLIKRHWKKLFSRYNRNSKLLETLDISFLDKDEDEEDDLESPVESPIKIKSPPKKNRQLSMQPLFKFDEEAIDVTAMEELQQNLKIQIIYSILSSIQLFWNKHESSFMSCAKNDKSYQEKADESDRFEITDKILKERIPEVMREVSDKRYHILEGSLIAWAPEIFSEMLNLDDKTKKFAKSLDLASNFSNIQKAGVIGGGKSGEFFFFSSDNNLIIKTISDEEMRVLIEILPYYCQHYKNNPFSVLAKIYGAFTFESKEPNEKYNLILMKNINGYPSTCVERKYDLKGSTVARETVKSANIEKGDLKNAGVLKDIDFNRFEEKLNIEHSLKDQLYETLQKDVEFLRNHDLTDYSMAIYVINKGSSNNDSIDNLDHSTDRTINIELSEEQKCFLDSCRNKSESTKGLNGAFHPFLSLKSQGENLYYHMGIIDYLCRYGLRKQLETFVKKLRHLNPNLDVSSQNSEFYAERFLQYMNAILY